MDLVNGHAPETHCARNCRTTNLAYIMMNVWPPYLLLGLINLNITSLLYMYLNCEIHLFCLGL